MINHISATVKFFNASLRKIKLQCNSTPYIFEPRKIKLVPLSVANLIYNEVKAMGVFHVPDDADEETLKDLETEALRKYLNETLSRSLKNFQNHNDDYKKMGITVSLEDYEEFKRTSKWVKELKERLGVDVENANISSFADFSIEKDVDLKAMRAKVAPEDFYNKKSKKELKKENDAVKITPAAEPDLNNEA